MLVVRDAFPDRPAFDMAVSHALLARVAEGACPPVLRLHRQSPAVLFGRLDRLAPGYGDAVAAARRDGFVPIQRLAGGHAAVHHQGTLGVSEIAADPEANVHVHVRFSAAADALVRAFAALGADARAGEVPGEYCAGAYSVNARGERKLSGTGQRTVRGAAYLGTIVVVRDATRVNAVLEDVYPALGLAFRPETTGALEDDVPGVTLDDVERAVLDAYGRDHDLTFGALDDATLRRAAELEARYTVP